MLIHGRKCVMSLTDDVILMSLCLCLDAELWRGCISWLTRVIRHGNDWQAMCAQTNGDVPSGVCAHAFFYTNPVIKTCLVTKKIILPMNSSACAVSYSRIAVSPTCFYNMFFAAGLSHKDGLIRSMMCLCVYVCERERERKKDISRTHQSCVGSLQCVRKRSHCRPGNEQVSGW